MIIIKAWRHILAYISLLFYKLIFAGKLYVGKGTTWRKGFSLMIAPNGKVSIGDNCFFNNNCSINSLGEVSIGDGCIFGEGVKIYDHNHRFADFSVPLKRGGVLNRQCNHWKPLLDR
jgi:acetyltransferase-like isoleucine patch superfamily enzyme